MEMDRPKERLCPCCPARRLLWTRFRRARERCPGRQGLGRPGPTRRPTTRLPQSPVKGLFSSRHSFASRVSADAVKDGSKAQFSIPPMLSTLFLLSAFPDPIGQINRRWPTGPAKLASGDYSIIGAYPGHSTYRRPHSIKKAPELQKETMSCPPLGAIASVPRGPRPPPVELPLPRTPTIPSGMLGENASSWGDRGQGLFGSPIG